MVEWPEEQHGIGARVRQPECAGITDFGTGEANSRARAGTRARLLDVQRNWIYEMDAVAALREPDGVPSGATADISDHRGRRREIALEHQVGARELEGALS